MISVVNRLRIAAEKTVNWFSILRRYSTIDYTYKNYDVVRDDRFSEVNIMQYLLLLLIFWNFA